MSIANISIGCIGGSFSSESNIAAENSVATKTGLTVLLLNIRDKTHTLQYLLLHVQSPRVPQQIILDSNRQCALCAGGISVTVDTPVACEIGKVEPLGSPTLRFGAPQYRASGG